MSASDRRLGFREQTMAHPFTCREFINVLDDFAAGSLQAERDAMVREHLSACAECAAYARTYAEATILARGALRSQDAALQGDAADSLVRALLGRCSGQTPQPQQPEQAGRHNNDDLGRPVQ